MSVQFSLRTNGKKKACLIAYSLVLLMMISVLPLLPVEGAEDDIDVYNPNGGEELVSGSTADLRWTINRAGGYIAIYLSVDGGENWEGIDTIANTPSHGYGWYDWFVPPNLNETSCRIKVTWLSALTKPWTVYGEDVSDANFTIKPSLVLTFKKVPTTISYAKYDLYTWNLFDPQDKVGSLRITWRVNDGSGYGSWGPLPGADYSNYDPDLGWLWWMPPYYESATAEIRIEAIAKVGSAVLGTDITPTLTIASPTITLIQPDGGVVLVGGSTYTIKWRTSQDPEHAIIDIVMAYSTDGGSSWNNIGWSPDDYEEDWTVPTSVDSSNVIVRVTAEWEEWKYLDHDQSSAPNRIISDPNTLTVSLVDPNPPVDGGQVLLSDETHRIQWSTTGSNSDIYQFKISYSIDSGSNWILITGATAPGRWHDWNVPEVDSYTARVRIELVPNSGPSQYAASIHDFYIFDTIAYDRPPIAMAGPDMTVMEDEVVYLDGSGSYDPDGALLTYSWAKISPPDIDLYIANPSNPTPFIQKSLTSFPVTFVIELTVSDGIVHTDPLLYDTDRISITVRPRPPAITNVWPDTGWTGTPIKIEGSDLRGAEVFIGGISVGRVPSDPVLPLNPYPDVAFTFIVSEAIPHGKHTISAENMAGIVVSTQEVEIFPEPEWQFENGLGFHNPTRNSLSYPWDPWGEGRYKDAFGNQVYLCLWVCIGLPYWTPWTGWGCLGYLIDEPFCPDPLAAIYYGAVFWWMAQYGECFGMSTTALRFYHDELYVGDYSPGGSYHPSELTNGGELREHVDYQQGAQMSSEILNAYLSTLISGLVPSSEYTGLGLWANMMKASIDSGDLGIATMICGGGAHAVVPYAYEEVDSTHTRFYIYDSNREGYSFPDKAIENCTNGRDENDNPPYIEVHKSGTYWTWSFRAVDGTLWSDEVGVAFVPWSIVRGPRTMPLSIDGIIHLLAGSADVSVEDTEGGRVGYNESGEIEWGIDGAAPFPMFSGPGWKAQSWILPNGTYTATVEGAEEGYYNWSAINNGRNAFSIERAETSGSSIDSISVDYPDGNPYNGTMEFGTNDGEKLYTMAQVNKFGIRERVYRIINATLTGTGTHVIGTNGDYSGIEFTNNGEGGVTFDVEFQGNVVAEAVWNGSSPPVAPRLPTASRSGITVGPGQTVVIRPTMWLDLNHALVIIEGETVPSVPLDLDVELNGTTIDLTWSVPDSTGGWPVLGYTVSRGDSADNLSFLAEVTGTSFTDDTVERGRTYHYSVQARNALGISVASRTVEVSIPALMVPGPPRDLTLTLKKDGVDISWSHPASDGGSPITGFVIMRAFGMEDPTVLVTLGNVTSHHDGSVANNTTYYYAVKAVNAVGEGPTTEVRTIFIPAIPDEEEPEPEPPEEDDPFPWWILVVIMIVISILIIVVFVAVRLTGSKEERSEE